MMTGAIIDFDQQVAGTGNSPGRRRFNFAAAHFGHCHGERHGQREGCRHGSEAFEICLRYSNQVSESEASGEKPESVIATMGTLRAAAA